MIITIFGDVHGNLIALEKLFTIEKSKTDLFIAHGDIVNYGPWSNECVAYLDQINNLQLLKGNHENYFLNGCYDGKNEVAQAFFGYCYERHDKALNPILENYKQFFKVDNFKIQHTIFDKYIFEDTDLSNYKITENHIIGHSHQQYARTVDDYKIFNTGSLGQNRAIINQSCYLKLNTETKTIHLKNFIHNADQLINEMKVKKYPSICVDYYQSKKQL